MAALLLGGAEYIQQGLALVVGGILRFHIALDLEEDELGSVLGHRGVSMRGYSNWKVCLTRLKQTYAYRDGVAVEGD